MSLFGLESVMRQERQEQVEDYKKIVTSTTPCSWRKQGGKTNSKTANLAKVNRATPHLNSSQIPIHTITNTLLRKKKKVQPKPHDLGSNTLAAHVPSQRAPSWKPWYSSLHLHPLRPEGYASHAYSFQRMGKGSRPPHVHTIKRRPQTP